MAKIAAAARCWIVLIGLAVAGCATTPPAPLLSPIQVAQEYGYSDASIGDNRYVVTYLGPTQRTGRSASYRTATASTERTQAYDFAVWHAAQIAEARGFAGFRVSNVRTNVNTFADEPVYAPPPWWGPGPFRRPWYYDPWYPYWEPSPFLLMQTEVTLDVVLEPSPGTGDYNARDVIQQLRQTYPGAEGPAPGQPAA